MILKTYPIQNQLKQFKPVNQVGRISDFCFNHVV
jgi:hypothetical protein